MSLYITKFQRVLRGIFRPFGYSAKKIGQSFNSLFLYVVWFTAIFFGLIIIVPVFFLITCLANAIIGP
jgi:hypothetical protein